MYLVDYAQPELVAVQGEVSAGARAGSTAPRAGWPSAGSSRRARPSARAAAPASGCRCSTGRSGRGWWTLFPGEGDGWPEEEAASCRAAGRARGRPAPLQRRLSAAPLPAPALAAEIQWGLLPPLTFASDRMVISGALEPAYRIGGDTFDYAVNVGEAAV